MYEAIKKSYTEKVAITCIYQIPMTKNRNLNSNHETPAVEKKSEGNDMDTDHDDDQKDANMSEDEYLLLQLRYKIL